MVVSERKSKEERREEIFDAALVVFAEQGLHGASTDEIARRAGISQPYVFRLFGTKKELYKAVIARCFRETLETFQRAAGGGRRASAARRRCRRWELPTPSSSCPTASVSRRRCRPTPPAPTRSSARSF